jgi:mercuric ion transport protein
LKERILGFFSLFGSGATLICCAIPALLSMIAGGAAIGTFISVFPWVIPLSRHKETLFIVAGTLLLLNGIMTLKPKGRLACAIAGGKGCETSGGFSRVIFGLSVTLYGIGAFAAYALVPIMKLF